MDTTTAPLKVEIVSSPTDMKALATKVLLETLAGLVAAAAVSSVQLLAKKRLEKRIAEMQAATAEE